MVSSRKREPIPEYPTRLEPSGLKEIPTPDFPYKYASGCHWLWGWAWKTKDLFGDVEYRPSKDDWILMHPCGESRQALDDYSHSFPVQVARIRSAFDEAFSAAKAWQKKEDAKTIARYHRAAIEMADTIFEVVEQIAVALSLKHDGPKDSRKTRAIELWDAGKHSWSEIAATIDPVMQHDRKSVDAFTKEIRRYAAEIGHSLRIGKPGSKKQKRQ